MVLMPALDSFKQARRHIWPFLKMNAKLFLALVLTMAFTSARLFAQTETAKYERIGVEQGLSHSAINCILQNRHGFS